MAPTHPFIPSQEGNPNLKVSWSNNNEPHNSPPWRGSPTLVGQGWVLLSIIQYSHFLSFIMRLLILLNPLLNCYQNFIHPMFHIAIKKA